MTDIWNKNYGKKTHERLQIESRCCRLRKCLGVDCSKLKVKRRENKNRKQNKETKIQSQMQTQSQNRRKRGKIRMKRRDEQRKRNEENGALCLGFFFCYSNKLLDAKGKGITIFHISH